MSTKSIILALLLPTLVACGGQAFTADDPASLTAPDGHTLPGDDAGTPGDPPGDDAGDPPSDDAGHVTTPDSGQSADANEDHEVTPPTDAGPHHDAGPVTEPDGGPLDSGTPPGSDSGVEPDGSTPPPPCTEGALSCGGANGANPLQCTNGQWVSNGGECNFGCSQGTCNCSAPTGRFVQGADYQGHATAVDTVTGETWTRGPGPDSLATAETFCQAFALGSSGTGRVANAADFNKVLAEVAPSQCSPDLDSQFASWISAVNSNVNLPSVCATGYESIQLSTGQTVCYPIIYWACVYP